jgi:putative transposase
MTSPPPLLYDTYYHIYNRGNNGENIFIQERNYEHFMNLFFKYISPIAETFAYCLLRNHFHVALKTRTEEEIVETLLAPTNKDSKGLERSLGSANLGPNYLSKKFSDFFNAYAKAINKACGRTGSLFQHPFGRVPITTDRQFWNVIAYIHQNPQKHKFVEDFRDWKWSSYRIILGDKPTKLKRDTVLEWVGGKESYLEQHHQWVSDANARWFAEDDHD